MIDIRVRLKRAILNNDLLVVKRLCTENPSCMRYCDKEEKGNTPLHMAAELGLCDIVVFLCTVGHEQQGISRNFEGQTPLMTASASLHSAADDVVFYLAGEYGKSVNCRDKTGMSALMMAAKAGNDANVNTLLDFDADINALDLLGNTSLHYASAYGHLKVIRTFIDRGANYAHRNREGWDAKDYSFSKTAEIYYKSLVETAAENMNMQPFSSSKGEPKRPGTAGSFSYLATSLPSTTSMLMPGGTAVAGLGGLGSTISFVNSSSPGGGTPSEEFPPPPPPRMLKSAASMVEFSHMDRSSRGETPPVAAATASTVGSGGGSVSSYASTFGSVNSMHRVGGGGSDGGAALQQGLQQQQHQQGGSTGGNAANGAQRNIYDLYTPLRPRASSGG